MASPQQRLAEVRERRPAVDHVLRMQEHYGSVKANQQAGAVTYFAFLSFFPVLALSVFVIGLLSRIYPDANATLVDAINAVLPGIVGNGENEISLTDIRGFSGLAGVIGLLGVVYSGLGWVSALRDALIAVFELPDAEQPNFVFGKLRDLLTLAVIGVVLLVSVAVAGLVSGFSDSVLGWVNLGEELGWLVVVIGVAFGLAANSVLFFAMFKLLADPHVPRRSLWSGALLGAVAFEVLKQVSSLLLGLTKNSPAFQAFGIALILIVWINYFSRVVMYAAAWAYTTPEARALRINEPAEPVQGPATPALTELPATTPPAEAGPDRVWPKPFAAGAGVMLALIAVLRSRRT
jgi:membrane protein